MSPLDSYSADLTPLETLHIAFHRIRKTVASELLQKMVDLSQAFF